MIIPAPYISFSSGLWFSFVNNFQYLFGTKNDFHLEMLKRKTMSIKNFQLDVTMFFHYLLVSGMSNVVWAHNLLNFDTFKWRIILHM
jgi:hypothetical protein